MPPLTLILQVLSSLLSLNQPCVVIDTGRGVDTASVVVPALALFSLNEPCEDEDAALDVDTASVTLNHACEDVDATLDVDTASVVVPCR